MTFKKISNFEIFLHNCDLIANYNIIQIYKDLLLHLSEEEIELDPYVYGDMSEMELRQVFNKMQKEYLD